jgi:hypothetical protein
MNVEGVDGSWSEVVDAVGVIVIKLGEFFGEQFDGEELEF